MLGDVVVCVGVLILMVLKVFNDCGDVLVKIWVRV